MTSDDYLISLPSSRVIRPQSLIAGLFVPQWGQGIGIEYTVALSSMSNDLKTCPQLGHLNHVFPRTILS